MPHLSRMRVTSAIALVVAVVAITGGSWLLYWRSQVQELQQPIQTQEKPSVDMAALGQEYQQAVRERTARINALLNQPDKAASERLRQELLGLRLPAQFRDVHIRLVLLLEKVEQSDTSREGRDMWQALTTDYPWIVE